jgi:hypothetical protein
VREDGFEPPLFTTREQIYSLLQHHHRCRSRIILVLLTHYLLCSTGLTAVLTVYVHSYSGMIKPMAYISKTNTTFNYTGCLKEITASKLPYHAVHGLVFLTHYFPSCSSVTTVSTFRLRFHLSCNLEVPVRQLGSTC